ncbi:rhamnan synthesis F family protein [Halomonas garicola]|uniref:rhamnan synthesis F family protein n=1 Tax=Halomonas garicola TaxID=1690008 RepID=UPI00289FB42A|nr:rhamnan synthesis F family protein [Halomonas garicola]
MEKVHYEILRNSGVDWAEYRRNLSEDVEDPVLLFLDQYEKYPLVVPGYFDSSFYLQANPDVKKQGVNPLVHYILFGEGEGRESLPVSPEDKEPVHDERYVGEDGDPQEEGAHKEISEDASKSGVEGEEPVENPMKHHLRKLLFESEVLPKDAAEEELSQWLDDLIKDSELSVARIEGFFDQKLYEAVYPDIKNAPINSFQHFILHGHGEGRTGWLDIDERLTLGKEKEKENTDTLLVVSHEASATGAPVVALEVSRRLSERFNVITATLKGGDLRPYFVEAGMLHLDAPAENGVAALEYTLRHLLSLHDIQAVVLNSVESMSMADAAASMGLPTLSLVHEFAEYTRPVGKIGRMLMTSDIVIYPAESLARSGIHELREKAGVKHSINNIRIRPQGYLGYRSDEDHEWSLRKALSLKEDSVIIAGAGHVQPRKGVDWFLEACHHLYQILSDRKDPVAERLQFVWLGNGYHQDDTVVSVWLDAYINRTGMKHQVHFPGAVKDVSAALREADIYLLTSRLDPFPNVAVDALNVDCGIGVFRDSSGIADFVEKHSARAVIADYGDPYHLGMLLADNLDNLKSRDGKNSEICRQHLDFDEYVDGLVKSIDEARLRRAETREAELSPEFLVKFNTGFYGLAFTEEGNKASHFLNLLRKGIALAKPFPGSDIQRVLDSLEETSISFEDLTRGVLSTDVPGMSVKILTGSGVHEYSGSVALQFHVFFADLIPEYCAYFKALKHLDVDLFVSHVVELSEGSLKALEESVTGRVFTRKIDNCGRDVYPFHRQFVEEIYGNYDVVGHFHTKKSSDNADGVGDRWRRYLLGNLIGSEEAANEVLGLFKDDKVGIVFAEDSHLVDEASNGPWIEQLLEPLGYQRWTHYRHFPLGTMFWARASALKDLLEWKDDIFALDEPVPYDGSVLHAFERILPQLVMENEYEVRRVYTHGTHW